MKSGSFWLVVIGFPKGEPLAFVSSSREEACRAIKDLPETDGIPCLFKLGFYKGRIYAKRQIKID